MKFTTTHFIALFCLVIILLASAPASAQGKVFQGNGYSIVFPAGWEISKEMEGVEAVAMSPDKGNGKSSQSSIVIMMKSLSEKMTIREYVDLSLEYVKKSLKGFNLISRKNILLGGQPAEILVYDHIFEGMKIKAKQAIIIDKGKVYTIVLSAFPDTYGVYSSQFDRVLKTIKFK